MEEKDKARLKHLDKALKYADTLTDKVGEVSCFNDEETSYFILRREQYDHICKTLVGEKK